MCLLELDYNPPSICYTLFLNHDFAKFWFFLEQKNKELSSNSVIHGPVIEPLEPISLSLWGNKIIPTWTHIPYYSLLLFMSFCILITSAMITKPKLSLSLSSPGVYISHEKQERNSEEEVLTYLSYMKKTGII